MQLVEQHVISRTDLRYAIIDAAAFASKNLYNQATYQIRQAYIIYDKQALGKRLFKKSGKLVPSALPIEIQTAVSWDALDQVRIVPRSGFYVIEVVYRKQETTSQLNQKWVAALDPGVNVLAAITSNKPGFVPRLVSGKPIKSLNQLYNKQRAHHQKQLAKQQRFTSDQLDRITTKRNRRINHYLHTASRRIIDLLVAEGVGTLCIGKNPLWKQEVNLGRKNNQEFCDTPHRLKPSGFFHSYVVASPGEDGAWLLLKWEA